ncbi:hypothetical protein NQZ68_022581 [Dissostichus eleginoides]|nr:hypothetical protein NQZ68_022581 [Dissostichus eleginoides]
MHRTSATTSSLSDFAKQKMRFSNCSSFWLINHQPLPHGACAKVLPNWSGKRQDRLLPTGRSDLHLPKRVCSTCHYEWTPDWGDLIRSGYWPASVNGDTLYSTDVFKSFEDLKTVAPGLSRQAFLQMLERRTQHYGRTGKIHGDVFERSFLEYMACQYECQKMTCEEPFSCPACTPKMLAVSVDGNRKQYRFRQSQRPQEKIVWSGRNLEGAGSTAGEEVEMVNSFLSRCAITTKYTTKSGKDAGVQRLSPPPYPLLEERTLGHSASLPHPTPSLRKGRWGTVPLSPTLPPP